MFFARWVYLLIAGLLLSIHLLAADKALSSTKKSLVSINLCTDQLLLLFPQQQPVYYSPLAIKDSYNYLSDKINKAQVLPPQLDRILLAHPEKVFASPYSDTYLLHGLKQAGIEVVIIPNATNFATIKNNIAFLARTLHEDNKGQQIIAQINKTLEALKKRTQDNAHADALFYAPNGFTHGDGTIYQAILDKAGLTNLAKERGIKGHGYLSLEELLWHQPRYLILEDDFSNNQSHAQALLSHPALNNPLFKTTLIFVNANYLSCAGMGSLLALEQIVEQL